jgi:flagellar hook-length control protein FliK
MMKVDARSLRPGLAARVGLADPGAGFAGAFERQVTEGRRADAPRDRSDTRAPQDERRSEGVEDSGDAHADEPGTDDTGAAATQPTPQGVEAQTQGRPLTGAADVDRQTAENPGTLTDLAVRRSRETAVEQAMTGPVTASVLTELALQGRAVGRFALIAPSLRPGGPGQVLTKVDGRESVAASESKGDAATATTSAGAAKTTPESPTASLPLAQSDQRPSAEKPRPAAAVSIDAAAGSARPGQRAETPVRPPERSEAVAGPAPASPTRQGRSDGRQDSGGGGGGRPGEGLRGLDAMLGRGVVKARAGRESAPAGPSPGLQAQLERGLSAAMSSRDGVVTLRLAPEQLGPLKIRVSVEQGAVRASFEAGTAAAQRAVERSLDTLKDALLSRGLSVERLEVTAAPPMPQREIGLFDLPTPGQGQFAAGAGDGNSSDGRSPGGSGGSGDGSRGGRALSPAEPGEDPIELNNFESSGMRYIAMPDGRLGIIAIA